MCRHKAHVAISNRPYIDGSSVFWLGGPDGVLRSAAADLKVGRYGELRTL
jgi:hypothetical protein